MALNDEVLRGAGWVVEAGALVVGSIGAAAAMAFSVISASISWSEGIMMGILVGRAGVSAPAAAMTAVGVEVEFGLAGVGAVRACCARNRSLRSGS